MVPAEVVIGPIAVLEQEKGRLHVLPGLLGADSGGRPFGEDAVHLLPGKTAVQRGQVRGPALVKAGRVRGLVDGPALGVDLLQEGRNSACRSSAVCSGGSGRSSSSTVTGLSGASSGGWAAVSCRSVLPPVVSEEEAGVGPAGGEEGQEQS